MAVSKTEMGLKRQKEKELVRRTLAGDKKAFNQLYKQHYALILATLLGKTRNRHDAEDLAQITFLHAYRDLSSYRGEAAFSTWLMQIALNACNTHLRAKRARRSWHETIENPQLGYRETWEPAGTDDPDDVLDQKERLAILESYISELPQHYHRAVKMRYIEDQSYAQIVHELGVPLGTLKTWLHRARNQLQKILRETEILEKPS